MSVIREYRKKRTLTQEQLAKALGVSNKTIRRWEKKQTTPNIHDAGKLVETLKLPFSKLLNDYK